MTEIIFTPALFILPSVECAYYFVVLPTGSRGLEKESTPLDAVVRASSERNIIYLRSQSSEKITSIILGLLQEHLVKPPTLQVFPNFSPFDFIWIDFDFGNCC